MGVIFAEQYERCPVAGMHVNISFRFYLVHFVFFLNKDLSTIFFGAWRSLRHDRMHSLAAGVLDIRCHLGFSLSLCNILPYKMLRGNFLLDINKKDNVFSDMERSVLDCASGSCLPYTVLYWVVALTLSCFKISGEEKILLVVWVPGFSLPYKINAPKKS